MFPNLQDSQNKIEKCTGLYASPDRNGSLQKVDNWSTLTGHQFG